MNFDSQTPSVVIVSSSNTKPKSIIKLMTKSPPIENVSDPNIVSQEWNIETKYYTTTVNLFGITENFLRTEKFNHSVEALIIHMDSNKESGLKDVQKWTKIEEDCNVEIKLLISNYFTPDTKISKLSATEWCLKRGYELIELYPNMNNTTEESDSNDIMPEKKGVDRVIEALQAHIWPNLVMKATTSKENQLTKLQSDATDIDKTVTDFISNDGVEDFTELLSQLSMFKESLSAMSSSQRKQNAEQLVTKFWQAIGGDEEELVDM